MEFYGTLHSQHEIMDIFAAIKVVLCLFEYLAVDELLLLSRYLP